MEFDLLHTSILCMFVFLGGFVDSIGGGGGLITLPAYFAMGLPPHNALATNKFSSSLGTLTSVSSYYRAGTMDIGVGLAGAVGSLFGSAVGAKIAMLTSGENINNAMLVLVPSVLAFFLFTERIWKLIKPKQINTSSGANENRGRYKFYATASLIGLVIGCYDGFFGPGTGTFFAIAFSAFLGLELLQASANARLANLASNTGSLVIFLIGNQVIFPLALYTAVSGIAGNYLGSALAIKKGANVIKPIMTGVLILLMAEVVRRRFM